MSAGIKANVDGSAAIQVGGTDVITLTSGGAATFVTSPTTVQAGTAAAPSITFSGDTNTGIYSPGADTIAFTEGGAEVARFDSSGNFGLGTTSPNTKLHLAAAGDVGGKAVNSATTGSATFNVTNNSGSIGQLMIYGSAQGAYGALGSGEVAMYCTTSTTLMVDNVSGVLKFTAGGNTERARFTSAGDFLVGTTNTIIWNTTNTGVVLGNASAPAIQVSRSSDVCLLLNRIALDGTIQIFARSGTQVGRIDVTTTATSYVTSSDYRLKENVQPMTGALAKVAALKPCTYTWKVDGSEGQGFIAHELAEVVPDAVTGDKDAVDEDGTIKPQGVDTSFLVATLTAAIQEQQAMIDELKAKVAALEGA